MKQHITTIFLMLGLGLGIIGSHGCIGLTATVGVLGVNKIASIHHDRRSTGTVVDDETLDISLGNWIHQNPISNGGHINFMVYNKVVLMTGEVPNKATKDAIVPAVLKQNPDIIEVINHLTVAPNSSLLSRSKDIAIKTQIELLFYDQEVFHPAYVYISVERGQAYLMGSVTHREADAAVKQVAKANGIKRIIKLFNYLKQRPQAEIEAAKRQQALEYQKNQQDKKRKTLEDKKTKIQQEINQLEKSNAF